MTVTTDDLYKQKCEIDSITFSCNEAHERLKIIRGYYASFMHASSLFKKDSVDGAEITLYDYPPNPTERTPRYGSHQKIYMSLQRSGIRNLADLGYILQSYHKLRKKAEYEIHLEITDDDVNDAESYFNECPARIKFYQQNGNQHFTTAKKVINASITSNGVKVNGGLRRLK
ncbi:hypothetical protein Psyc_2116 [Psychrobacter arcticus 273-4]|uniref:Uncharacterized protein n=1 Tax=Psychrobacter arcticus (strain DSM 17307 / VKM B-2377 / 273-4) TaxID=259536 RepID=Q4FPU5_PSYA2|nr:hypothetical protein [Psychrobacter arcticus]AAZ19963.1 hypothetical protein Psyc_2116 [Psychrobacter arcticus 273-4]